MQEYHQQQQPSRNRSGERSHGHGVPDWVFDENDYSAPPPPPITSIRSRSSSNAGEGGRPGTYTGLSGSPDTRRKFYPSRRQQQQQQLYNQQYNPYHEQQQHHHPPQAVALDARSGPQHHFIGSMQQASEPIYMDIDPSIHQSTMALAHLQHEAAAASSSSPLGPPHRASAFTETTTPPRTSPSRYSTTNSSSSPHNNSRSPSSKQRTNTASPSGSGRSPSSTPSPRNHQHMYETNDTTYREQDRSNGGYSSSQPTIYTTDSSRSQSPKYPYMSPYVSNVARDYRVPGGMFQNQPNERATTATTATATTTNNVNNTTTNSNNSVARKKSLYDERPINDGRDQDHLHGDQLIMFGDDYDLGSINTGMSQQELLQKRRDVKKRRDGKQYGKKKKAKERIINMPPRLLSMGSWDTSPITKLTSKDNSQHTPYKESKEEKKWKIIKAFTPPEEGSTDASTRESGDDGAPRPQEEQQQQQQDSWAAGNHHHHQGDNVSLNSFPLLSTNAKEEFASSSKKEDPPADAPVRYSQPGNIPQLQVDHHYHGYHHQQQQSQKRPPRSEQEMIQQQLIYQSKSQERARSDHMDIYHRQHGEELQQLESHLRYLQEQHQELEQEIQERQIQPETEEQVSPAPSDEYQDNRPRSVRFADMIAQDLMQKQHEMGSAVSKESPTSVAEHLNGQDNSNGSSVISPKDLFPAKPVSILRRKTSAALDSTGRYPGSARGRTLTPLFIDGDGREVSPIRSPGSSRDHSAVYQMESHPHEDGFSLPENPDDKDVAVLFESEPEDDLELMRREFDEDSGLISDAFIEAVASIVLQTAIRRFLAIRRTHRRRMELHGGIMDQDSQDKKTGSSQGATIQQDQATSSNSRAPEEEVSALTIHQEQPNQSHPMALAFFDLAAVQIQSVFRGWWVRDSINVDHYCTTLIQKAFRGFRARVEYDYDVYRIIVVQSVCRKKLALRSTRHVVSMVIKLQALCRGILVRQTVNSMLANSARAEKPVSSARRETQKGGEKPSHTRTSYERAKARKRHSKPTNKPKTYFSAPATVEEARIWHVGAIIIQTYWRSYVCRICYFQSFADVIMVQSVARRWLVSRRLAGWSRPDSDYHQGRHVRQQPAKTQVSQASMDRGSVRFSKFESFEESRNMSSTGAEDSWTSSSKKTHSGVPFHVLSEDDGEQAITAPQRQPEPQKTREHDSHKTTPQISPESQQTHGHFDDPNRFGGARSVWDRSGAAKECVRSQQKQYDGRRFEQHGHGAAPAPRKSTGRYGNHGNGTARDRQMNHPGHGPRSRGNQAPRSEGWNPQQEIDKEGTRNLLQAWKQKDKANTFTIKPRSGGR